MCQTTNHKVTLCVCEMMPPRKKRRKHRRKQKVMLRERTAMFLPDRAMCVVASFLPLAEVPLFRATCRQAAAVTADADRRAMWVDWLHRSTWCIERVHATKGLRVCRGTVAGGMAGSTPLKRAIWRIPRSSLSSLTCGRHCAFYGTSGFRRLSCTHTGKLRRTCKLMCGLEPTLAHFLSGQRMGYTRFTCRGRNLELHVVLQKKQT